MKGMVDKYSIRQIEVNQRHGTAEEIKEWLKRERDVKLANRLNVIRLFQMEYKYKVVGEN
ncbi:MAG: hypothetical protein QMD92_03930 [bacterium]|nr:hypothetical protein [bacterium]